MSSGLEPVREDLVVRLLCDACVAAGRKADVVDGPAGCVLTEVGLQAEADLDRRRAVRRRRQLQMVRLPARLARARIERRPRAAAVRAELDVAEVVARFGVAAIVEIERR